MWALLSEADQAQGCLAEVFFFCLAFLPSCLESDLQSTEKTRKKRQVFPSCKDTGMVHWVLMSEPRDIPGGRRVEECSGPFQFVAELGEEKIVRLRPLTRSTVAVQKIQDEVGRCV